MRFSDYRCCLTGFAGTSENCGTAGMVTVDDAYLRESMMEPNAKVVNGFLPIMPTYKGVLTDREVEALIAYIKSLK